MKPPSPEKDIWEEWLLSALERTIYLLNELHYDKIFNKEVLLYFNENVDYAKAELKRLDDLYGLNYIDYTKSSINYIAPLIITLLKYDKGNKAIVNQIKQTTYYSKLLKSLVEDPNKPNLFSNISTVNTIDDRLSKFYYSASNKTRITDTLTSSIKIHKV